MFVHKNDSFAIVTVFDEDGNRHTLQPGEEVTLNVKRSGQGVIILNDSVEAPTIKKRKKSER